MGMLLWVLLMLMVLLLLRSVGCLRIWILLMMLWRQRTAIRTFPPSTLLLRMLRRQRGVSGQGGLVPVGFVRAFPARRRLLPLIALPGGLRWTLVSSGRAGILRTLRRMLRLQLLLRSRIEATRLLARLALAALVLPGSVIVANVIGVSSPANRGYFGVPTCDF